jgi:hypothetical protein
MSTAATSRRQAIPLPLQSVRSANSRTLGVENLRRSLSQRKADALTSLLWSLPPQCDRAAAERLVAALSKSGISAARRRQVETIAAQWLNHADIDAVAAWEGVALLHALPTIAPLLDDARLSQLWERWQELSALAGKDAWDDDPVRFQLLAVETPLLLAGLDNSHRKQFHSAALSAWCELATGWLDEQGLPDARYLAAMRPVLASWTRCTGRDTPLLAAERRVGFVGLLRQAMRLTDANGREAFSRGADPAFLNCLSASAALAKDRESTVLRSTLLPAGKSSNKLASTSCSPSVYSESRRLAILRSRLTADSPRLTVVFDEPACRLELGAEQPLLSGQWTAELTVDGERLMPRGAWEEVCRHEDDDVEYLELETELGNGWTLQRHILLAREENFAFLADAVLGEREATLSYTSSLPLAASVELKAEPETHEGWLSAGSKQHLALPLALPEWRSDRPLGTLSQAEGRLSLTTHPRRGRNLFQPLLIPLSGSRRNCEYTWRPITVAENLVIQPPDAAAAYRVQIGDRQWVVYRALTRGNRTFLGRNLTSELFVGIFHRNGEMDAIMEVE